jgi:Tfp pilus assembly protein FimV
MLREALDTFPTMARPHLDLALLLQDHNQDFIRAIYHFQRYLELRPNTEKDAMIRERIALAKRELVLSLRQEIAVDMEIGAASGVSEEVETVVEPSDERPNIETDNMIAQLESDISDMRLSLAERERLLEQRQNQIAELEESVTSLQEQLEWARVEASTASAQFASAPENNTDDEAGTRTYAVRANDSLSVIAKRVYGDATKWRVIQDANREVLGDSEMLRIGQVLEIPKLEERR